MARKDSGSQGRSEVISLNSRRIEKKKIPRQKMIRILSEELMGESDRELLLAPPSILKVKACPIGDTSWELVILDEDEKTYHFPTKNELLSFISTYLSFLRKESDGLPFHESSLELSTENKKEVIKEIFFRSRVSDEERSNWTFVGQKSDPRWCLCRLPFDIEPAGFEEVRDGAPTVFEFLDRIDRPEIFSSFVYESMMGIGSRKKALWLQGPADTLKTSALEAIGSVLGQCFASIPDSHFDESYRWLISELVGKMLVLVDDADRKITNWTTWKTVTGSSVAASERKGQDLTQVRLTPRLAVTSNFAPEFDGSSEEQFSAQKTRLLYCRIKATERPPQSSVELQAWKARFLAELPWLLGYGKHTCDVGYAPIDFSTALDDSDAYHYLQYFQKVDSEKIIGANFVDWCRERGIVSHKQRAAIKSMLVREFDAKIIKTNKGIQIQGVRLLYIPA